MSTWHSGDKLVAADLGHFSKHQVSEGVNTGGTLTGSLLPDTEICVSWAQMGVSFQSKSGAWAVQVSQLHVRHRRRSLGVEEGVRRREGGREAAGGGLSVLTARRLSPAEGVALLGRVLSSPK